MRFDENNVALLTNDRRPNAREGVVVQKDADMECTFVRLSSSTHVPYAQHVQAYVERFAS